MNDGFVSDDFPFSIVLAYLYTFDSILKIDAMVPNRVQITFDIASEDAKLLQEEFRRGELSVEPKAFCQIYSQVTRKLRNVQKFDDGIWNSESWVSGVGA